MTQHSFTRLTVAVIGTAAVVSIAAISRSRPALAEDKAAQQVDETPERKDKKETPLQHFMRRKMNASNLILEGLVMENSTFLKQGGEALLDMSKAETFQVLTDKEYRLHNREFRDATKRMIEAAEKESYDKVALAWFDVTISCVDCHDHVRKVAPQAPQDKN